MDREQEEMQFIGFFGIYKEFFKLIYSWRKIFSYIFLSLILPLSFIYLHHMEVTSLFVRKIIHNEIELDNTRYGTPKYNKLSDVISSEWAHFWLFQAVYLTLLFIFSLFSTASVVYTVACAYTTQELTFEKVMSVVPKVWKRLMVTFLSIFASFFLYNVVAFFIFIIWEVSLSGLEDIGFTLEVILRVLYWVGFLYLFIICHLANVVSVLEEAYGFKAMVKSKNLIKGKIWVVTLIFLILGLISWVTRIGFQIQVVDGSSTGFHMANRIVYAVVYFLLQSVLFLLGLVIQTVVYFVCKSYHHENIDKSALTDHLEVYLGEYVPLTAKDVQLEQYHV